MKIATLILFLIFTASLNIYSQKPTAVVHDPPIPYVGNLGDWGTDLIVSNSEPLGRPSGVVRPTDTLYVAIPDTLIVTGACLAILRSTNNGTNWSVIITVTPAAVIAKTRMVRSGLDSIYCTMLFGPPFESQIYILKVNLPLNASSLRPLLNGGYRDFDCWASSTGGYYLFVDSLYSGYIPRYASSTGGVTWSQRGLVTSTAANPFIYKSGSGDTVILAYYQLTAVSDTTTCGITIARYREAALGSLSSIAFLTNIIPAGPQKAQFGGALYGGVAWFLYTSGAPGSRDIMYILSTNGGVSYGSATPLANNLSDEYNFDIKHYTFSPGGADVIYYWDSTGGPTNATDKLLYTSTTLTTPTDFSPPLQISENPPQSSTRGYIPFLMEYYNADGDVGAVWVGLTGSNRKVFFDRLGAPSGISHNNNIPEVYSLSQNYPNPFNPVTKIEFSIAKAGTVKILVYDILGREVSSLVNKDMKAGKYTVNFDATGLSSGIYFYRLTSGNFTDVKKMVLLK